VAGDIGYMYRPSKFILDLDDRFSFGTAISNIGPSVSYIDEAQSDPLPTIWRLGVGVDIVKEKYNRLTWTGEAGKMLISRTDGSADPFWTAIGKSFQGDWVKTITFGTGFEYWYSQLVALRLGYFHEDPSQGNRRFLAFGAGVRYDIYGFDFSYISTALNSDDVQSPLSETLRFTLMITWDTGAPQDDGTRVPVDDATN
jgi:hypothetical protein